MIRISALLACLLFARTGFAEEAAEKLFRTVNPAVVGLENLECQGTGILLSANGLILTNAHVVSSPLRYRALVDVPDGKGGTKTVVYTKVSLVGVHPTYDLALLKIDLAENAGVKLTPAKLSKAKAAPGKAVYTIGNPAISGLTLSKSITSGMLSAVDRMLDGLPYYQFDAAINPGNSGGPLLDKDGNVLGLVTYKITDAEGIGFAIPLHQYKQADFVPQDKRVPNAAMKKIYDDQAREYHKMSDKFQAAYGLKDDRTQACLALSLICFRLALAEDPRDGDLFYNVGMSFRALDEDRIATAYLVRAISLNPRSGVPGFSYRELGFALVKQNKRAEAKVAWTEGLSRFPREGGKIWEDLSIAWIEESNWAEACWAAKCALAGGDCRVKEMTRLYGEARAKLPAAAQQDLDRRLAGLGDEIAKMEKTRDETLKSGKTWMTPEFEKFLKSYQEMEAPPVAVAPPDDGGAGDPPADDAPPAKPPAEDPAAWIKGKMNLARSYEKNAMREKAIEVLQGILDKYPDHPDSKEAFRMLEKLKK